VEVAELEELIDVAVIDDGHGFDPAAITQGFGLRGMRERVQLAGGSMSIDSSETGSAVRARLPAGRSREGGLA
jgi:signal transduction histidine kinase